MHPLSIRLAVTAVGAALATGAAVPGISHGSGGPTGAWNPSVTAERRAAPSTSAARHSLPAGWRRCTNTHNRYSIGYPGRWYTTQVSPGQACQQFDPNPFTIPVGGEYPVTALNAAPIQTTVDAYLRSATDPMYATTLLREETRVGGRRAIRFETISTGAGLSAKGSRRYGYVIDRDGHAFATFTMALPGERCYPRNTAVVDRAVRTVRFG